ncbi:CHASE3 domain-containing protein [Flavobacterium sp. '19STA2R22 D10 B1']|uniref:sensor histidine kinase n=1 Tax=Flavobacterium aerium TaxID=3037261 RepID=UPI00278BB681|nr:CHASE3 domain-containing protein [Flavobacterium sp. '19STA2R22 D10 B1']
MKLQSLLKSSTLFTIVFAVSVFVLFFIASLSNKQIQALNKSQELVVHSHKVHIELEQLVSIIKDAETGQRGYIITHDLDYLQTYNGSRIKANQSIENLKTLAGDNFKQLQNIDVLQLYINKYYLVLAKGIDVSNVNRVGYSKALRVKMIASKKVMSAIRQHVNMMINEEMLLLQKHEREYKQDIVLTPLTSLLVVIFSLLVFIFSFQKINSDVKNLKRLNRRLLIMNETFAHAEAIADISHWEWNLETNELNISDNHYRLLGVEPNAFESTIDNYMEYVHPEDREVLHKKIIQIRSNIKPMSLSYRVIRKDGKLRYFKSTGKLMNDNSSTSIVVGVTCDITSQHLNIIRLKQKNRELESSNAELASFNHIASHDLQEPLRKIQMFVSRIKDKDQKNFSESGREYFERIQSSANRMQTLINDLLMYSRTGKREKIAQRTDLNVLLDTVKQEMTQLIDEKKAVINAEQLPTIDVIPFQMQQLFTNLIANSLKYSKENEIPTITIKSEIVDSKDLKDEKFKLHKKYYQISFSDNGIGFDQQYADKIFILFHRLHNKNTYYGTGIGLAICKKIMENHHGFIEAKGINGVGATFTIYLPK